MNNSTNLTVLAIPTDQYFKLVSFLCGCILLLVFLCSLVLSSSVLLALWKTKQLHSPVYRMVGYILLDEILVRVFGSPLTLTSMLAGRWLFGEFGCIFYAFWMTWLGVTATSLFTCVAIERYVIVCRGGDSTHGITNRVVDILALVCYLHGFVWACLPLLGVNKYVYEPSGISCTPNWSPDSMAYILGLFTVCFIMPVSVSIVCYSCIVRKVRDTSRRIVSVRQRTSSPDKGVTATVAITIAAFLFSWTPYSVIGLLNITGVVKAVQISKEISLLPLLTAKTAGMWNPLIFSFNNKDVRNTICSALKTARDRLNCIKALKRKCRIANDSKLESVNTVRTNYVSINPTEGTVLSALFEVTKNKGDGSTVNTETEV